MNDTATDLDLVRRTKLGDRHTFYISRLTLNLLHPWCFYFMYGLLDDINCVVTTKTLAPDNRNPP